MQNIGYKILVFLLGAAMVTACVEDEFDVPQVEELPVGNVLTIKQLRDTIALGENVIFDQDCSVYGVITMDDKNGNIYKTAYLQDGNNAIALHFNSSGGVYQGDSVRIFLKGLMATSFNELAQIDAPGGEGFVLDSHIVKQKTMVELTPKVLTISDVNSGNYQAQLVKLEGVQFSTSDTAKTFADAVAKQTVNLTLTDSLGNSVIVRTSGYASFADENVPNGFGSLVAIAGQYNNDMQLYIRSYNEVQMDGERWVKQVFAADPVESIDENFQSQSDYTDINMEGWLIYAEAGDRNWQGKTFDNNVYAQASGYNSGLESMVSWMITPPIIMSGDEILSFRSAIAYWEHSGSGKPLQVMISTDFDGVNVSVATWNEINVKLADKSQANYAWVESGEYDLSAYTGNIYVAFKYTGSGTESTSSIIDDVYVGPSQGDSGNETTEIFVEDFGSNITGFNAFSVTGAAVWEHDSFDNGCAKISGYQKGENEDWLVSPAIDLSDVSGAKLEIREALNFKTSYDDVQVLISSDYDGTSSPDQNGTWNAVPSFSRPAGNNWNFQSSGDIDISDYDGESTVYIAFKYICSSSNAATWEIGKVTVKK